MASRQKTAEVALAKLWEVDSTVTEDDEIRIDQDFEPVLIDEKQILDECHDDGSEIEDNDDASTSESTTSSTVLYCKDGTVRKSLPQKACISQTGRIKPKYVVTI